MAVSPLLLAAQPTPAAAARHPSDAHDHRARGTNLRRRHCNGNGLCRPSKWEKRYMSLIAWLVVGLLAGWIGSMIVNRRGEGLIMDIVLGVVGAFVGGFLFHLFGHAGVSGINFYSIFVAVVGATVVLVIYHAIARPRRLL
jgi:uncharacterized membrane protein YeaQ/YmgE (transglycosylase-associated protein family)